MWELDVTLVLFGQRRSSDLAPSRALNPSLMTILLALGLGLCIGLVMLFLLWSQCVLKVKGVLKEWFHPFFFSFLRGILIDHERELFLEVLPLGGGGVSPFCYCVFFSFSFSDIVRVRENWETKGDEGKRQKWVIWFLFAETLGGSSVF